MFVIRLRASVYTIQLNNRRNDFAEITYFHYAFEATKSSSLLFSVSYRR